MRPSFLRSRPGQVSTVAGSFLLLWAALAGGDAASWWIGVPLAGVATAMALAGARGRQQVSLAAVLRFIPVFLWRSLAGGVDVARRALDPRLPIEPAFLTLRLRYADPTAVILVTGMLNLHPGTLSVDVAGDRLTLHVIDRRQPIEAQVRAVEDSVARLLGLPPVVAE